MFFVVKVSIFCIIQKQFFNIKQFKNMSEEKFSEQESFF